MNQGFHQDMVERARELNPNGRPLRLHFSVDLWTDQCATNTALALECLFVNFTKQMGLHWLGTNFKRVEEPGKKPQTQRALFASEDI